MSEPNVYDMLSRKFPVKRFADDVLVLNRFIHNGEPELSNTTLDNQWCLVDEELNGENKLLDSIQKKNFVGVVAGLANCFSVGIYAYYIWSELGNHPDRDFSNIIRQAKHTANTTDAHEIEPLIVGMRHAVACLNMQWFMASLITMIERINSDMIFVQQEVLQSYWDKFPLVSVGYDPELEVKRIEDEGHYSGVTYTTATDDYGHERYVFWSGGKKAIKPSVYYAYEPDLTLALSSHLLDWHCNH